MGAENQKTGDISGNVELESEADGCSFALPWLSSPGARPASQYMLLAVLGESFSGSVAVSDGLGRLEEDDEDEEEEPQSVLDNSAKGDKKAMPMPTPLLEAEPVLLSPTASGNAERGTTAGEELEVACLCFCSA